jgi:hypothetical protein
MIASIPQWILLVCMLIAAGHDPDRGGEVGGPALCESGSMQFQDSMGIWAMTMIDVIMILRSLSYRILLSFGFEWNTMGIDNGRNSYRNMPSLNIFKVEQPF